MQVLITPPREIYNYLTRLSLASHKRGIGERFWPWSDAAERGVWSGSTLFALSSEISTTHYNNDNQPDNPDIGNGPVQIVKVEESTRHKLVNNRRRHDYICISLLIVGEDVNVMSSPCKKCKQIAVKCKLNIFETYLYSMLIRVTEALSGSGEATLSKIFTPHISLKKDVL